MQINLASVVVVITEKFFLKAMNLKRLPGFVMYSFLDKTRRIFCVHSGFELEINIVFVARTSVRLFSV